MKAKTGIVAYNETELVAWSLILAMNEIIYFIQIEQVMDRITYVLYIDKITNEQYRFLKNQYDMQFDCKIPIKL